MKYLALLRGINVGGNNIIKKDALKGCFEAANLTAVLTYIQSGNILFKSGETDKAIIVKNIQFELKKTLKNKIEMVIFSEEEYTKILRSAHKNWGIDKTKKHNALFLLENLPFKEAKKQFPKTHIEYEEISFTNEVIFWSGSKEHYRKTSYVKHLVKSPLYKLVTIRNSNTSLKLKELFEQI